MLLVDAEPSRKERGHRGVRPRHPPGKAFGLDQNGFLKRRGTASFSFSAGYVGRRLRGCDQHRCQCAALSVGERADGLALGEGE